MLHCKVILNLVGMQLIEGDPEETSEFLRVLKDMIAKHESPAGLLKSMKEDLGRKKG